MEKRTESTETGKYEHGCAAHWTRGSIRAMVRGTVTQAWARNHHPGWYREITGGEDR